MALLLSMRMLRHHRAARLVVTFRLPLSSPVLLEQHADWRLVQLIIIVLLNVFGCFTMPMFDPTKKNWAGYFAYLMVMGGLVVQLPPTHSLLQWLFSAPIIM